MEWEEPPASNEYEEEEFPDTGVDKGINTVEGEGLLTMNEVFRDIYQQMCNISNRVNKVQEVRRSLLRERGYDNLADHWEVVARMYASNGLLTPLFLMTTEEIDTLDLNITDLMAFQNLKWDHNHQKVMDSKKAKYTKEDVVEMMKGVGEKILLHHHKIEEVMGSEKVSEIMERNRRIQSGISTETNKISGDAALLFPKDKSVEIMRWYSAVSHSLDELKQLEDNQERVVNMLAYYLAKEYPGPEIRRPTKYSRAARQEKRGSQGTIESPRPENVSGRARSIKQEFIRMEPSGPLEAFIKKEPVRDDQDNVVRRVKRERVESPSITRRAEIMSTPPTILGEMMNKSQLGRGEMNGNLMDPLTPSGKLDSRFLAESGYQFRLNTGLERVEGRPYQINVLGEDIVKRKSVSNEETPPQRGGEPKLHGEEDESQTSFSSYRVNHLTKEEMQLQVRDLVEEKLAETGNESGEAMRIVLDNLPIPSASTSSKVKNVTSFNRIAKDIKVDVKNQFINVAQWWKKINDRCDDLDMPIITRIKFLRKTGGLADNVNNHYRQRVIDFMEDTDSWLPSLDLFTPDSNERYWLEHWVLIGLKFIEEFFIVQRTDDIDDGLKELMKAEKYKFNHKTDPLNRDFYKVVMMYQDINIWLKDRGSGLVHSPLYVMRLIQAWLEEQGIEGKTMNNHISRAFAQLSSNPLAVLPQGQKLSEDAIRDIKRKGQSGATAATYKLVLEGLKRRAINQELMYDVNTLSQLSEWMSKQGGGRKDSEGGWEVSKADRKKAKKVGRKLKKLLTRSLLSVVQSQ